jgi:hypothetical protein
MTQPWRLSSRLSLSRKRNSKGRLSRPAGRPMLFRKAGAQREAHIHGGSYFRGQNSGAKMEKDVKSKPPLLVARNCARLLG